MFEETRNGAAASASPAPGPQVCSLPDGLDLVSGRRLEHVDIAYETFGTLDADKANAVLICHALSGDAHVAAGPDRRGVDKPGWWDVMVGPGMAIDTDRYHVICSNVLGGCSGSTGPGSLDPATDTPYGTRFPLVTIEDMVSAQAALLDRLGIEKLVAVVGGSMGGMQALVVGQAVSRACPNLHRGSHDAATCRPSHRVQRGRTHGHSRRPQLRGWRLLRRCAARAGARHRAHGRPHHVPLRRVDARQVRPAASCPRRPRLRLCHRVRGGELPGVPRPASSSSASTPTRTST